MARAAVRPEAVTRRARSITGRPPKPGFLEMVDPTLVDAPPSGGRWGHEIKWDGYRAQAHLKDGRVQIFTRQGHDWTRQFWPVAVAITELKADDAILDGEMVAIGESGRSDFHALRRQLGETHPKLVYQAFDLLWLDGEDLRPLPLLERKQRLARLLSGSAPVLAIVDFLEAEGRQVLKGACALSLEGIVSKRLESPYKAGRSNDWLKAKCAQSETFAVVGFSQDDNGRIEGLYLGRAAADDTLTYAGAVEHGLGDALPELERRLRKLVVPRSPIVPPPKKPKATWTRPEVLVEVEYPNRADDGRIRHPRFKGLRDDLAGLTASKRSDRPARPATRSTSPRGKPPSRRRR